MNSDLIVLSHLRWDFVYQRPQHLLTRFAKQCRVFYIEEPWIEGEQPRLEIMVRENGVRRVVPFFPPGLTEEETNAILKTLIDQLITQHSLREYALWYYTPMALPFTK
ncbi:MAG: hypothetical protein ACJ763_01680, partial [Bdellovibrionia bacterium]